MHYQEFLERYPQDVPQQYWQVPQPLHAGLNRSMEISAAYGNLLHLIPEMAATDLEDRGALSQIEQKTLEVCKPIDSSKEWFTSGDFNHLVEGLYKTAPEHPKAYRHLSGLNFHTLNLSMACQWTELFNKVSEPDRLTNIAYSHSKLAYNGLSMIVDRETAVKHGVFFNSAKEHVDVFNGSLNELDAAVVLLEISKKHPGMSVLPAPAQFESYGGRGNSDFIVFHDEQAVGVQVKSTVTSDDREHYDPEAVVLIDAGVDMHNKLAKRTESKSSRQKVVTWPGLITLAYCMKDKSYGNRQNHMIHELTGNQVVQNAHETARRKFMARSLMGGVKPEIHRAAQVIGDRLMQKLEPTQSKTTVVDLTASLQSQ